MRIPYLERVIYRIFKRLLASVVPARTHDLLISDYQRRQIQELFTTFSPGMQILESVQHLGGANQGVNPAAFAPAVWSSLYELLRPKSFVDFGCGLGYAVRFFAEKGIDSRGVEGSEATIRHSPVRERIIQADYTNGYALDQTQHFDLGYSQEFVEHVPEEHLQNVLHDFRQCRHLALTHGLPGQVGHHHVNCRTSRYWINCLENAGFMLDKPLTLLLRRLARYESRVHSQATRPHTKWFARTGMVFHRVEI